MPSSIRPPLIESIVEIILAVRAGFRNAVQITTWPRRTRSVIAASAASAVNDSNVISSVGRGTVWKWSKSHSDSNPRRSASRATAAVRCHASSGSQPSNSPCQPWGAIAPIFTACLRSSLLAVATIIEDPGAIGEGRRVTLRGWPRLLPGAFLTYSVRSDRMVRSFRRCAGIWPTQARFVHDLVPSRRTEAGTRPIPGHSAGRDGIVNEIQR